MRTSLSSGCHSELCFTVSRKLWISPQQHEFSGNGTAGWNPSLWLWSVSHVPSSPLVTGSSRTPGHPISPQRKGRWLSTPRPPLSVTVRTRMQGSETCHVIRPFWGIPLLKWVPQEVEMGVLQAPNLLTYFFFSISIPFVGNFGITCYLKISIFFFLILTKFFFSRFWLPYCLIPAVASAPCYVCVPEGRGAKQASAQRTGREQRLAEPTCASHCLTSLPRKKLLENRFSKRAELALFKVM